MKTHIKTTNLLLTPDVKEYLDSKIEDIDRLIDPNDTSVSAQIELGKTSNHHQSGDIYRAEINLSRGGKYFRAVSEQDTIFAAIDEIKHEIMREIKSYSSKQITMMRRGGAVIKNMMKGIGSGIGSGVGAVGNFGGRVSRDISGKIGRQFKRFRKSDVEVVPEDMPDAQ